ncbi:MAG: hypothetical protein AB1502_05430 [Thermodesulfobacteriota bacterium]
MPTIISDHPLDKIFGDIPARLPTFHHASVRHYDHPFFKLDKKIGFD